MTPLRLTPAQRRVLSKIALGKNTHQTAGERLITSGTVAVQLTSISRKLGVSGRAALVHAAYPVVSADSVSHAGRVALGEG